VLKRSNRSGNSAPAQKRQKIQDESTDESEEEEEEPVPPSKPTDTVKEPGISKPKSILKSTKMPDTKHTDDQSVRESIAPRRIPQKFMEDLAQDDAEIAFLEKKLGLKGRKTISKAFKDDGLDELLGSVDALVADTGEEAISEKAREDEWLAQKRQKARAQARAGVEEENMYEDIEEDLEDRSDLSLNEYGLVEESDEELDDGVLHDEDDTMDEDDFSGLESESDAKFNDIPPKRVRENPYVPPTNGDTAKYIPPSLRKPSSSDSEAMNR